MGSVGASGTSLPGHEGPGDKGLTTMDGAIYCERVSSARTTALFWGIAGAFATLLVWRVRRRSLDGLGIAFLCLAAFFLFYALNYKSLMIRLTPEYLTLTFGIFSWRVPLANVAEAHLDDLPPLLRYGGAGIHWMTVRRRYRVSLNFLEYPRLVIALRTKAGPVQDVSFSTRRPNDLLRAIQDAMAVQQDA